MGVFDQKRRARGLLSLAGLAAALATGCSGSPSPIVEETEGELGNGVFRWQCVDGSDPTCGTGNFPNAVALGSTFDLDFTPADDIPGRISSFRIEAVSPSRLSDTSGDFVAMREGGVSIIATGDEFALDFLSLDLLPVDGVRLVSAAQPGTCVDDDLDGVCDPSGGGGAAVLELFVQQQTQVEARPLNGIRDLAGALPYEWESLTPELLTVSNPRGNAARLTGLQLGTARLVVRIGDYSQILDLEVVVAPEPDPTTTGEPPPPDTESSSGSGSDSGSGSGSGSDTGGTDSSGSDTDEMPTGTTGESDGGTTTGGAR
ncbi:MAG: hypothetical protein K0V04_33410 [Deltaproteobacteria bacterium]|nr:hypothetical protein [Deltaproteobacteria bacterium]